LNLLAMYLKGYCCYGRLDRADEFDPLTPNDLQTETGMRIFRAEKIISTLTFLLDQMGQIVPEIRTINRSTRAAGRKQGLEKHRS